ncbi:VCBS repeat-containing protein [Fulvivirgaceae bacterium BMA10]|uniref:VCBS repeat-containing protein n=1 Tax=Splendidivirga corallicola TaxID=3051826 RepID=A0ABT8KJR0_9BACT|nr:VCBS repeat-containing protein [Fulvivirgaceae bacterium BMA10]
MSRSNFIGFLCVFALFACEKKQDKLFTNLPANHTGIEFKNVLKETEEFNVMKYGYFYNGGGVAVGDINNDGLPDIYFTGNLVASRLYLNKGDLRFEEIAEDAGVLAEGLWNTGTSMADVNGDGWLDIYVCRSAAVAPGNRKNLLFINNGDLTFTESANSYGLDDSAYSTQATFFDYDRDGDLDMYLLNHSVQEYAGFNKLLDTYKRLVNPDYGDKLYRNDGDKFVDVTLEAGIINNVLGFGLGVTVSDVNGDGWFDIYVGNDYNEEDYLYLNNGDGTFKESLADHFGHVSHFSMGCDGGDINNDLKPDIVTLDMLPESNYRQKMSLGPENYDKYNQLVNSGFHYQTMRNMLQLNNGNGYFSEIGQMAGISNTDWSWSALIADYDNDGWKDLFITNGYMRNYLDMDFINYVVNEKVKSQQENKELALLELISKMPSIKEENYIYQNNGDLTFSKKIVDWGFDQKTLSNGAAYADLDNDGDLDLIVNNINERAHIYRNNSEKITGNNYLRIDLKGKGKNTKGIGAKVILKTKGTSQYQEQMPARGFQSSVSQSLVFGLGKTTNIDSLIVIWPDSSTQKLSNVRINTALTLDQGEAIQPNGRPNQIKRSSFDEVADKLGIDFKHEENGFLDFKRDRLLPHGISTMGPCMIRGDINADGLDDLFLGGAKGQSGKLYLQSGGGSFIEKASPDFTADKQSEDTDGILLDVDGDDDLDLYVVSGGSDFTEHDPLLQDRLYINDGKGNFSRAKNALPEMLTSGGTVATTDIDNDGDPDLFVGGRLVPGRYPVSPRSYVLRNNGQGEFEDITQEISEDLIKPGMVTEGIFTDLNNDQNEDLVLVGEWMSIRTFINKDGKLTEITNNGLENTSGWWNTVVSYDFDQDGDSDLIAGNMGTNSQYKANTEEPITLVYGDFDQNGMIDPIMNYYIQGKSEVAFSRDELIGQIASLKKKFPDYQSYAQAELKSFFEPESLSGADTLWASMLESVCLINDGKGNFEVKPLPIRAQFAPVYSILCTEINGDDQPDIILGGNLTQTRVSTGRYDANYGMVFLGDGDGSFEILDPLNSGLNVRGEVRDMESLRINGNNYLLISRNDDEIKVYRF